MNLSPRGAEAARLVERVGAPLRQAREEAGLTMAALGRRAGMKGGAVSALERGRQRPTRRSLLRLADALMPGDHAAALAFADRLAMAAGPSLASDVTLPVSVTREMVVAVMHRSALALGFDLDDERVRAAVVQAIRDVSGDPSNSPAAPPLALVRPSIGVNGG